MAGSVSLLGRPTFGGLASGLDTNALLEGLLALERQPLQRIQSRRGEINQQRSLMRDFNGKVVALREAAQKIDNRNSGLTDNAVDEEFLRFAGSSSNEDVVTITAGFGASPGDVEVIVDSVATRSRRFSESYASSTDATASPALAVGETFRLQMPNGDPEADVDPTSIEITADVESGALSLQDLRDQINTAEGNGGTVRADVLQISDDDFRLVLTSTETGASSQLFVTGDVAMDTDPERNVVGQDAQLRVFGEVVTRESNLIDDVLSGVTLRLQAASDLPEGFDVENSTEAEISAARITETVTIETDVDEVANNVDSFVKAYNDVISFIEGQFRYNESTNSAGPLAGDFTLRDIQRQLREMVSDGYQFSTNANNPFAPSGDGAEGGTISGIGIELDGGGRLRLNKTKLEEALAQDARSVREFLSGRSRTEPVEGTEGDDEPDLFDDGFATRVAAQLDQIVRSGDGTLASRDDAYETRLGTFDDTIERFERRLSKREETLIQRFSELERIVSSLQGQQGFLTSLG